MWKCYLLCVPWTHFSVHEIIQARILEWVVIHSTRDLPDPGIEPGSPALWEDSLPSEPPGKPLLLYPKSIGITPSPHPLTAWGALCLGPFEHKVTSLCCCCAQSYLTLCDPMDCSPPGSSVRGILQARILEWIVFSFSRGIFPMQASIPHLLCLYRRMILYCWAIREISVIRGVLLPPALLWTSGVQSVFIPSPPLSFSFFPLDISHPLHNLLQSYAQELSCPWTQEAT